MCTVSYFPLQEPGYILTSNRDERISRSDTLPPAPYALGKNTIWFPRDQESSGTWIAASASGKTYCLLNGAFHYHKSEPPYRKSRGLVLLEMIQFSNPEAFIREIGFEGIEPFTLVMIHSSNQQTEVQELRWDGLRPYLRKLNSAAPMIWSSATLYDEETRLARENWFHRWIRENPQASQEDLLDFHRFGGDGDVENNLIMKRSNDRQTISITSVFHKKTVFSMQYHDLVKWQKWDSDIC